MKVAIPVEGENLIIFTRTGRAPFFAIFECNENDCEFLELRENPHAKEHEHEHHHEEHSEDEINHHHSHIKAARLGECKYLVCRALGPNMKAAIEREGIIPIKISKKDGENALEVLGKIKDKLK